MQNGLGTVYAVDKQIQRQNDGSLQLDIELEQRLNEVLKELVKAVKPSPELGHAN